MRPLAPPTARDDLLEVCRDLRLLPTCTFSKATVWRPRRSLALTRSAQNVFCVRLTNAVGELPMVDMLCSVRADAAPLVPRLLAPVTAGQRGVVRSLLQVGAHRLAVADAAAAAAAVRTSVRACAAGSARWLRWPRTSLVSTASTMTRRGATVPARHLAATELRAA
jgi:hypothetical protein